MQEILAQMLCDGVEVPSFEPNGKVHRNKSFWAIGFSNHTNSGQNFFVAMYGDWSKHSEFKYQSNVKLDKHDKDKIKKQILEASKKAEAEKRENHERVANEVAANFNALTEGEPTPYMVLKHIDQFYGAKTNGFELVIPICDKDGKIWSHQKIGKDFKLYAPGGKIRGNFHTIGTNPDTIYVCEGFATGVTIHKATNRMVAVAFDCGNLLSVTKEMQLKYPNTPIVVCGDEDQFKDENAGRKKATEVAEKLLVKTIFPVFKSLDSQPTDFNDLEILEGLTEVENQLQQARLPATVEWTTRSQTVDELLKRDLTVILPHWFWSKPSDKNPVSEPTRPMATIENFDALFKALGVSIRYNVISKRDEIRIPETTTTMDNEANTVLSTLTSWCERLHIAPKNLDMFVNVISDQNAYNPVADWIATKDWDGVDRLEQFYQTVVARNERADLNVAAMKEKLLRVWLIQALAAIYNFKGVSAAGILVFLGDQYIGKTKWFKSLLPDHLADYRADGVTLNTNDKDSIFNVISHWLVELGELDGTLRKSDMAQLKAFVTKDRDKLRRPYAKKESEFARRTVFFASVNEPKFLMDKTGNRRFWTIDCESLDYNHTLDMQQLWAQVKTLYDGGETHYLSNGEVLALNAHNEEFENIDPVEEQIRSKFAWDSSENLWKEMNATQIVERLGFKNISNRELRSVTKTMKKFFNQTPRHRKTGWFFKVPPIISL